MNNRTLIKKLFLEFSRNPRVMIDNEESEHDFRIGHVVEIRTDGMLKVQFENGPGSISEWFQSWELEQIPEGVNIKRTSTS